jgi:hypothetical protein
MDEVIKQELKKGQVRLTFQLSISDLTSFNSPKEIHTLCSRYSYLPIVSAVPLLIFKNFTIEKDQEVWFSTHDNFPLKRLIFTKYLPFNFLKCKIYKVIFQLESSMIFSLIITPKNYML